MVLTSNRHAVLLLFLLLPALAYAAPSVTLLSPENRVYYQHTTDAPLDFVFQYSSGGTGYDNATCNITFDENQVSTGVSASDTGLGRLSQSPGIFSNHLWRVSCDAYKSANTSDHYPSLIQTPAQNYHTQQFACPSGAETYAILSMGERVDAGNFVVRVEDVSNYLPNLAFLSILDMSGAVVGQITVNSGDAYTFTSASNGKQLVLGVFQIANGTMPTARWVEMSVCYRYDRYFNFSIWPNEMFVREQVMVSSDTVKLIVNKTNQSYNYADSQSFNAVVSGPNGTNTLTVPPFNGANSVQAGFGSSNTALEFNAPCPENADGRIYLNVTYRDESSQIPILCKQHLHCTRNYSIISVEAPYNIHDSGAYKLRLTNVTYDGTGTDMAFLDILDAKGSVVGHAQTSVNRTWGNRPYLDRLVNGSGITYSAIVDGIGTIQYHAYNLASGMTAPAQWAEIESCNIAPPSLELVSPADGYSTAQTTVQLVAKYHKGGVTQNTETCNATIDGTVAGQFQINDDSQYTYTTGTLAPGTHTWKFDCLHVASASRTFTIQGQAAASVELVSPADGYSTKSANTTFAFRYHRNSMGGANANCMLWVGGQAMGTRLASDGTDSGITASGIKIGDWGWNVTCDAVSSPNRTLHILPPQPANVTLAEPADKASLDYNNPDFTFVYHKGDDGIQNASCTLMLAWANASFNLSINASDGQAVLAEVANLTIGSYNWSARCEADGSLLARSENRSFVIAQERYKSAEEKHRTSVPNVVSAPPPEYSATGGGELNPYKPANPKKSGSDSSGNGDDGTGAGNGSLPQKEGSDQTGTGDTGTVWRAGGQANPSPPIPLSKEVILITGVLAIAVGGVAILLLLGGLLWLRGRKPRAAPPEPQMRLTAPPAFGQTTISTETEENAETASLEPQEQAEASIPSSPKPQPRAPKSSRTRNLKQKADPRQARKGKTGRMRPARRG